MPFSPVPLESSSSEEGKFRTNLRKFFNQCGASTYSGSLKFKDAKHKYRYLPIFTDECLKDTPQTYILLRKLRRLMDMPTSFSGVYALQDEVRSIHQNENGYLPYKNDGNVDRRSVAAPAIRDAALAHGQLPNNQSSRSATTRGQFLEYTCGDGMHAECRLIVDYRFGLIYMTFGHYNPNSFALLVRSEVQLSFEISPILPSIGTEVVQ